jgi:flagellar biosynthesis/type III secretory pathway chaperone
MKKEVKNKKITIDKLAVMMNNSFESLEKKMATKEDIKGLKEDVGGLKNQLEGTNKRIDNLAMNRVKYEDHNKLKVRVDFIEEKLEIKK